MPIVQSRHRLAHHTLNLHIRLPNSPNKIEAIVRILDLAGQTCLLCVLLNAESCCNGGQLAVLPAKQNVTGTRVGFCGLRRANGVVTVNTGIDS